MRRLAVMLVLCAIFAAGCSQYIMHVQLFDRKGRPVMESVAIAVEGKYISGYKDAARKEPYLKDFFVMDEFTLGELVFGVAGMPETFRLSANAPGFYKMVSSIKREVEPDGYVFYGVVDASSPYSTGDIRIRKEGTTIYIDAKLEQFTQRREGGGY
jgi:hypothetical protein